MNFKTVLLIFFGIISMLFIACEEKVAPKVDPIITWATPDTIMLGDTITEVQLNATSNVPGLFQYQPDVGAVLNVGWRPLRVSFIPDDTLQYNIVNKEIAIYVQLPEYIVDIDSNKYKTVSIGPQIWFAENLKTSRLNNGTPIEYISDLNIWLDTETPAYCFNDNDTINRNLYGALYNWYSVETQDLCPSGWHVATNEEWQAMVSYLIELGYNYDGSSEGNKLAKALATDTGWVAIDNEGVPGNTDYPNFQNMTGFSALPGGYRDGTGDIGPGGTTRWWTATSEAEKTAYYWGMTSRDVKIFNASFGKAVGFSVRCILDK
ncbi:MAG: fibrobacter succinogenes major paralogous domain-containing protein [Bacteroidales bacterium]|nr:fibrobacter succinogenes major paralogous domain-containing protein [Bacteroidales bacterium]